MFLKELATEIREINEANGWDLFHEAMWHSDTNKVPAVIALIKSELDEAFDGMVDGDIGNVKEELADVLIRILDNAGGFSDPLGFWFAASAQGNYVGNLSEIGAESCIIFGWELLEFESVSHAIVSFSMMEVHSEISRALEFYRGNSQPGYLESLGRAFHATCALMVQCFGCDPDEEVRKKLDKNRTRGFRHGGKLV